MVNHLHRQAFNWRSAGACFAADAAVVLLFVTVGVFFHASETISAANLFTVGWPLAVGVVGGYVAVVFARWPAISLGAGLLVSIKMIVMAVLLRAAAGDAYELPFIGVAALLLVGGTVGWRALALRRLNGAWPRDTRTAIARRSRLDFLRGSPGAGRRRTLFD